jgi:hypothetical protein
MTEYIKNQLIKLCDNPEWFNDMLNTWDFKPERESQAIKEYLSHVLLNGKLENTHIERIEMGKERYQHSYLIYQKIPYIST